MPLLATASDVVDIGCGRGELLALLAERGVTARGVDVNPAMVELCRSRGLAAEQGDALSFLERQADGSIGGLVAIQVVEHFAPAYLAQFLESAFHKMRPGAPLVLETINPACWKAFFDTYIRDLTHRQPLHPDTLRHLVQASGFTQRRRAVPRTGVRAGEARSRRSRKSCRWRGFRRPAHRRAQRARRQAEPPALFLDGLRRDRAALTPAPGVTFRGRFGLRY